MSRYPRLAIATGQYHIIARFNNDEYFLKEKSDFLKYLSVLQEIKEKHGFYLFNYELMNSHVHLFLQPSAQVPLSKTMMMVQLKFARYCNQKYKRKGHVWRDRYQCLSVEREAYALTLMRYMNSNPLRAKMVKSAGEWPWSGYQYYGLGKADELLDPHSCWLGLGNTASKRLSEYSSFVKMKLPGDNLSHRPHRKSYL